MSIRSSRLVLPVVAAIALCAVVTSGARLAIGACPNKRPLAIAAKMTQNAPTTLRVFTCSNVGVPPADDWKWGTAGSVECPSWTDRPAHYLLSDCSQTKLGSCCGPNQLKADTTYESKPPSGASQGAACSEGEAGTYGCAANIVATSDMFWVGTRKNCDAEGACAGSLITAPTEAEVSHDEPL